MSGVLMKLVELVVTLPQTGNPGRRRLPNLYVSRVPLHTPHNFDPRREDPFRISCFHGCSLHQRCCHQCASLARSREILVTNLLQSGDNGSRRIMG